MSIVSDSKKTANKPADPAADPVTTFLEDLAALQRDVEENIPRILAAAKRMEETLRAQQGAALAEALPEQFATRLDGALLLCTHDLANRDLSGREQWTGIVLTSEEKALVLSRLDDCAQEAAAKIAVKLPKKKEEDGEDE